MRQRAAGHTTIGQVKKQNEDAYLIDEALGLYLVCDGIGGRAAGGVASTTACGLIRQGLYEHRDVLEAYAQTPSAENRQQATLLLRTVIDGANLEIRDRGLQNPKLEGMASTVACLLIVGRNALVAHAGDSRVYLRREEHVYRLTDDHSLVQEQLRQGLITPEDALHGSGSTMVVRALGMATNVDPDTLTVELLPGDVFLLCTDGLSRYVTTEEIGKAAEQLQLEAVPRSLIDLADKRSGKDNITAVAVEIDPQHVLEGITAADKITALREIPQFRGLTYFDAIRVLSVVTVRSFRAGRRVIEQGAEANELLIGLAGRFRVSIDGGVLGELPAHTTLGEGALVLGRKHQHDVHAVEDSKVLAIARQDLNDLLSQHPSLGVKFLWSFCQVLAGQLASTGKQLARLKPTVEA